jgi:SAM-dependent methyltransferase
VDKKIEWDSSYHNGDNILFAPNEEVIRFVSKYIRKRTGLNSFQSLVADTGTVRILDLGCGIGRHIIFCQSLDLDTYGIDLSDNAISIGKLWAEQAQILNYDKKIIQGDIRSLPWDDGFFTHAISHGVLDSMPFEIAQASIVELHRTLTIGGLFYCDLISGDNSQYTFWHSGEEVVKTKHEKDTIQSYFNIQKIETLFKGYFQIKESFTIRKLDNISGEFTSRYHLVLIKI